MKKISVHIKELDKKGKKLSFFNLNSEIVNFLYKDTVAQSTKSDQLFFVLLFFLSVKLNNKTALENLLEENLPKFTKLNDYFINKKGRLVA